MLPHIETVVNDIMSIALRVAEKRTPTLDVEAVVNNIAHVNRIKGDRKTHINP
jgi:hypothetical protein